MNKIPVIGLYTPKRQLKLVDVFTPNGHNICPPESSNEGTWKTQGSRADLDELGLVRNGKRADNFENLNTSGGQRGQKKFDIHTDYGVKMRQVKHDDNPSKGIKTSEDQRATISNQVCVSQTSSVGSIEKDKGQGGLSQNQSQVEKLFGQIK